MVELPTRDGERHADTDHREADEEHDPARGLEAYVLLSRAVAAVRDASPSSDHQHRCPDGGGDATRHRHDQAASEEARVSRARRKAAGAIVR
ncbi:MAG: hypothetical protein QOI41_1824 [Myxococcales bacterium]|nr:hypothetical protein [Myxococcales bacterium]